LRQNSRHVHHHQSWSCIARWNLVTTYFSYMCFNIWSFHLILGLPNPCFPKHLSTNTQLCTLSIFTSVSTVPYYKNLHI
jgi:hypothetical protein